MSTANTRLRAARAKSPFVPNALRLSLQQATAVMCTALLAPAAFAADVTDDPEQHARELGPTVITAVAPSSPLTVITNPKDPRQPVPASDGGDYLKTIPGFAWYAMAAPTATRCCAGCSVRA